MIALFFLSATGYLRVFLTLKIGIAPKAISVEIHDFFALFWGNASVVNGFFGKIPEFGD